MDTKFTADLNCDMGESFGVYHVDNDAAIMPFVTSVNIACGFHAGDPSVIRKTVRLAIENDVLIGAHPGYQDLQGFGRREMVLSSDEIYDLVVYQIGALLGVVKSQGATLHHVKPHGALYNMAAVNPVIAGAIARAVRDIDSNLVLYGLSGSEIINAGRACGLQVANEVFADRTYQSNGSLTPRREGNALIEDHQLAAQRAVKMVKEGLVSSVDGTSLTIAADTICIHGDGTSAVALAKEIFTVFKNEGISVR